MPRSPLVDCGLQGEWVPVSVPPHTDCTSGLVPQLLTPSFSSEDRRTPGLTVGGSAGLRDLLTPFCIMITTPPPHHQSCFSGNEGISGLGKGEAPIGPDSVPGPAEERAPKPGPPGGAPCEPYPQVSVQGVCPSTCLGLGQCGWGYKRNVTPCAGLRSGRLRPWVVTETHQRVPMHGRDSSGALAPDSPHPVADG